MSVFDLPTSLRIGEVDYLIRYGWRAVMDIFIALNDPELDEGMKMEVMLRILYPDYEKIPEKYIQEAIEKACWFLDCGMKPDEKRRPRTMDWEQDAAIILPEINKIAGKDVRWNPNEHWWTFFGWYMGIESGVFCSVLHIRQKKVKGKKLEKYEEDFYRENKEMIDLRAPESDEIRQEKEALSKWL